MSDEFRELAREMFALYERGEHAAAYGLVSEGAPRFPDMAPRIYFWRACLAARMDRPELAIDLLEEGLDAGHWYWPVMLKTDSDLEPVRDTPRFAAVVTASEHAQADARAAAGPPTILTFESEEEPVGLLLAFHGNSSSATESAEHWRPATGWGWTVALPQSGQMDGPGMYAWNDPEWTRADVQYHRSMWVDRPDLPLVLGGFSMGAWWAIQFTLSGELPAIGFVAVSAYIQELEAIDSLTVGADDRMPRGYAIVGGKDPGATKGALRLQEQMRSACEIESHPEMGHTYPDPFTPSLKRALEFVA